MTGYHPLIGQHNRPGDILGCNTGQRRLFPIGHEQNFLLIGFNRGVDIHHQRFTPQAVFELPGGLLQRTVRGGFAPVKFDGNG